MLRTASMVAVMLQLSVAVASREKTEEIVGRLAAMLHGWPAAESLCADGITAERFPVHAMNSTTIRCKPPGAAECFVFQVKGENFFSGSEPGYKKIDLKKPFGGAAFSVLELRKAGITPRRTGKGTAYFCRTKLYTGKGPWRLSGQNGSKNSFSRVKHFE